MAGSEVSGEQFGLVADIGGTNARFALASLRSGELTEIRRWRVADHATMAAAAAAYLRAVGPDWRVSIGAIAVAGPTNRDEIQCTNCTWRFSISELRDQLGFDELHVINDFAANGWALPTLGKSELHSIGLPVADAGHEGTYAILGPGTGLGVGAVHLAADGRRTALETEGGHIDFAPLNDIEDALMARLRARYGRVSYERLICGRGLVNIYDALSDCGTDIAPEHVTASADPIAARAVEIFCEILGSFAGDVALMYGAWNGVYLAGGLLKPMLAQLRGGAFRRRFEDKGRFRELLSTVPTMLVDHASLGLVGASAALRGRLGRS
jgi:glucokinase